MMVDEGVARHFDEERAEADALRCPWLLQELGFLGNQYLSEGVREIATRCNRERHHSGPHAFAEKR